ncbi:MAG: PAS domain S-box protein [Abditibacteriaceae bacterium]
MFGNRNKEATAHLAAIIDSSEDAIVSKDLNGIIKSWNGSAERLFGYDASEVIGKSITIIVPEGLLSEEAEILAKIRKGERITHFETIRQDKWGNEINISLTISPIKDEKGKIIGASKIARDISEEKRLKRELQEMNERKDEFLAILSHELRNPLAAIRGGLDLLHRSNYQEPSLRQSTDIIERQTNHIVHIVDDLLDITHINQGEFILHKERIILQDAIEMARESCSKLNEEKQHEFFLDLPCEPIFINGDLSRVAQILINLISNAIKYTPRCGIIRISLEQSSEEAYIKVQDNGIGIPSDKRDSAFEMFHRIKTNTAFVDGLGVGLGIAKKLTEMHSGYIKLSSNHQQPGCEFVVVLPLALPESLANETDGDSVLRMEPLAIDGLLSRKKVLIIDDNKDAIAMFEKILSLEGYDVCTAIDGEAGIEIATNFYPDVCLCDIGLPQMDGFQVAAHLRKIVPETKLIALSGWGRPEDIARSHEVGFSHHVVKSTNFDEILMLIRG